MMRRLIKALLLILLSFSLILMAAWFYGQSQLKRAGISHWSVQLHSLSWQQLTLDKLQFTLTQPDFQLDVYLTSLAVNWTWQGLLRLQPEQIVLQKADLRLNNTRSVTDTPNTALSIPVSWQLPSWLAPKLRFAEVNLTLPCAELSCQFHAEAELTASSAEQWRAKAVLSSTQHPLQLAVDVDVEQSSGVQALQATLQLEQQLALSLKHQVVQQQANTSFVLAVSPPSAALLALLADFQLTLPAAWLAQFQQPLQLYAVADWTVPTAAQTKGLMPLNISDAKLQLLARAQDPFIIPGLGWLQGDISSELTLQNAVVTQWQFAADLALSDYVSSLPELSEPYAQLFAAPLAPLKIRMQSVQQPISQQPSAELTTDAQKVQKSWDQLQALLFNVQINSAAPLVLELHGEGQLKLQPDLSLTLQHADMQLDVEQLKSRSTGLTLKQVSLQSQFSGFWQANQWQLTLADRTQISAFLQQAATEANVQLQLNDTHFAQTANQPITLHSNPKLAIKALQQPTLYTQDWQWQAELTGPLPQLALTGELSNTRGIVIPHQIQWQALDQFILNWQLADIFLLAGNPLQDTLQLWPELLAVNRGRFSAAGQLSYQSEQLTANAMLQVRELAGLFDRTLFAGLSSQINVSLQNAELKFVVPTLQLNELNHGLQLGPLQLSANYTAPWQQLSKGKLQLEEMRLRFMQGELVVAPQLLDLSEAEHKVLLQVNQVDLTELLRQHPTTDLSAKGKISGQIPLVIKNNQFNIVQGNLAAEQPGGQLNYRPASAATGQTNPNMQLVFDALADFHFSVLSADISYSAEGKLLLAIQLQGANPAVQQGRAIHLNVNLEEDLPAMLASLQLTNKLNDTLTKRVQQHIQRQQAAKAAAGEKP
ncbi:intermembrane phospholipid transport protein YdbH family protein [Alishewanella sp. d11]|uniref:intermembrane phospholipid transport protein YdbH family protein n=1 Tax=Alishewanella sp. d11 TaxID=3414030 RepID=UPI003BF862B9